MYSTVQVGYHNFLEGPVTHSFSQVTHFPSILKITVVCTLQGTDYFEFQKSPDALHLFLCILAKSVWRLFKLPSILVLVYLVSHVHLAGHLCRSSQPRAELAQPPRCTGATNFQEGKCGCIPRSGRLEI